MRDGGSGETGEMMRTVMDEGGDIYPAWPRSLIKVTPTVEESHRYEMDFTPHGG